jgi:hypothetical protein
MLATTRLTLSVAKRVAPGTVYPLVRRLDNTIARGIQSVSQTDRVSPTTYGPTTYGSTHTYAHMLMSSNLYRIP